MCSTHMYKQFYNVKTLQLINFYKYLTFREAEMRPDIIAVQLQTCSYLMHMTENFNQVFNISLDICQSS